MTKKFPVFPISFIVLAISASCAHPSPNHRPTHGDFQRPRNINQFPDPSRFQERFICEPWKGLAGKPEKVRASVFFLDKNPLADYNEAITFVYFTEPGQTFAIRHIFEDAGPPTARFNFTKDMRIVYVQSEKGWREVKNKDLIDRVLKNAPNEYIKSYQNWDNSKGLSGGGLPVADNYKRLVENSGCSMHDKIL